MGAELGSGIPALAPAPASSSAGRASPEPAMIALPFLAALPAALVLLVADAVRTSRHRTPINDLVQSWEAARDAWARRHGLRVAAMMAA